MPARKKRNKRNQTQAHLHNDEEPATKKRKLEANDVVVEDKKRKNKRNLLQADLDNDEEPVTKKRRLDVVDENEKVMISDKQELDEDECIFESSSDVVSDLNGEHEQIVEIDDIVPFLKQSCSLNLLILHVNHKAPKSDTGKNLLELVVTDSTNHKIKIIFWDEKAMEFGQVEEGSHWKLTNFRVRKNSSNFQVFNQHYLMGVNESEMKELSKSEIKSAKLPLKYVWNFIPIGNIENLIQDQTRCNVIGVIVKVDEVVPYTGLYGRTSKKREIQIMDKSGTCSVTLWNQDCEMELKLYQIIAVIAGKPSAWNQVSLTNIGFIKEMKHHPDWIKLKKWLVEIKPDDNDDGIQKYLQHLESKQILKNLITFDQVHDVEQDIIYSADTQGVKYCLVMGKISEIEAYNMTYEEEKGGKKTGEIKFKLNITIENEKGQTLRLMAFDDIGKQIFKTSAHRIRSFQMEDQKKFAEKMKMLILKQTPKVFRIQVRRNDYYGNANSQMILNLIKPGNAAFARKTNLFPVKDVSKSKNIIPYEEEYDEDDDIND